ncbi:MAG TPA: PhzF family phenazine biosynthesis protein [Telluria sp.]|nr:PhzF family phenazine biosynthesis protein [Telluria sp.]
MQIQELRCFGDAPGSGNPALVVEHAPADPAARAALARERNSTVVFVDGAVLDYYYPHKRSPLCLHATLAAAALLFARQGSTAPITVTTAMAGQPLVLLRDGADVYVRLQRQPAPQAAADLPALLGAAGPAQVASVGSPKLLVELADAATLQRLAPDLAAIAAWGQRHGVNGIYAWCRLPDGSFEGRNFNHLDPALEDSATGVAAGALAALLGHDVTLRQGAALGRPCLLRARVAGDAVLVGGRAEPA